MGIFLKYGDLKSDGGCAHHKDWIPCESISGGTSRPMYLRTGGGKQRETQSAELHEMTVTMKLHKASPDLFLASLSGEAKEAFIHVTRAGNPKGAENYLDIHLHEAFVTRYSIEYADGDAGRMPMETITLNYTKIIKHYHPNKSDGKPGTKMPTGFNAATGEKC
jgi:type VI secretion system secreted protein Hcp